MDQSKPKNLRQTRRSSSPPSFLRVPVFFSPRLLCKSPPRVQSSQKPRSHEFLPASSRTIVCPPLQTALHSPSISSPIYSFLCVFHRTSPLVLLALNSSDSKVFDLLHDLPAGVLLCLQSILLDLSCLPPVVLLLVFHPPLDRRRFQQRPASSPPARDAKRSGNSEGEEGRRDVPKGASKNRKVCEDPGQRWFAESTVDPEVQQLRDASIPPISEDPRTKRKQKKKD